MAGDRASDRDATLVTARCAKCGRTVSAPLGELRATGVFACICGAVTRGRYVAPLDPPADAAFGKRTSLRRAENCWRPS